mmetsp:Transcript_19794/g.47422  ORF Transcript_19794/g.47422 Transcript_19794/m.47422 type:complete len:210 (+) Transcript_19794:85-714(+)
MSRGLWVGVGGLHGRRGPGMRRVHTQLRARAGRLRDRKVVNASHRVVNVIRPQLPRLLLQQDREEPLDHLLQVPLPLRAQGRAHLLLLEEAVGEQPLEDPLRLLFGRGGRHAHRVHLLVHEARALALAEQQLLHEHRHHRRQVDVERGAVQRAAAQVRVVGAELDGAARLAVDVDEPRLLVVARDEDVVEVVEVEGLQPAEREVAEGVE